jgi:hypothetical protein
MHTCARPLSQWFLLVGKVVTCIGPPVLDDDQEGLDNLDLIKYDNLKAGHTLSLTHHRLLLTE